MEKEEKKALDVYETMCSVLERNGFDIAKEGKDDDGDYTVRFGAIGDDLPMEFVMFVDPDRSLIRLMSLMPFKFRPEKRVEGAIVTSAANTIMVDGNFDYDYETGQIIYKETSSYMDSLISEELLMYMIKLACNMVDEFNDKFLMVDNGSLSVEEFLERYS